MIFNNDTTFYKKDFSKEAELIKRIRDSLFSGKKLNISNLELPDYDPKLSLTYITLFQKGTDLIRYGSKRNDFESVLNRDIEKLRENKNFKNFDILNSEKCRIMIEYVTKETPVDINELQTRTFNRTRFEPGVTGIFLRTKDQSYYYMPTDSFIYSHNGINSSLSHLVKKTPIAKMTDKIPERIKILRNSEEYKCSLVESHAFISYKDDVIPLYRGNILYDDFNYDTLLYQFIKSSDWLVNFMHEDGRFLYYYDAAQDNYIDHEHPTRREPNLYYNILRHSGGTITLLKAYTQTKDKKYLEAAKKSIDYTVSNTRQQNENTCYVFYNKKAKLGGTGLALTAMMQYRIITADKSYDDYIKGYARHLISRIYNGEFLGYYIHPGYHDGQPLINMTDKERKETFSFYYPGEALLGLGLFANHFEDDKQLVQEVCQKCEIAMDWIVNERPKIYKDLFTALPSDAWLMQAIQEWVNNEKFIKDDYLNFVYQDANTMVEKMYTNNNNPYLDYEGGYYYQYGDHFYPDGARSEGLISAYYLAKKMGHTTLAEKFLEACKKAAKSQFYLFNCEQNSYAHKNPDKSKYTFRFKMTRQWIRVDSIQHVACFFARLYEAEH